MEVGKVNTRDFKKYSQILNKRCKNRFMKPWSVPKRKMKVVISGFQHKMKIHIFTIPFAWTAPVSLWLNLCSGDASLKYFLGDLIRKHVYGRCHSLAATRCTCVHGTCQLPRYTSLVTLPLIVHCRMLPWKGKLHSLLCPVLDRLPGKS